MTKIGLALVVPLLACGASTGDSPASAGDAADGGVSSGAGGDHGVGSTPPVALSFIGAGGAAVHLVKIASGLNFFDCGIGNDGRVYCWGTNNGGQLGYDTGNVTAPQPPRPVDLGTGQTVKDLAVGYYHVCAILSNDAVKCWGFNHDGQLGLGDTNDRGAHGDMGDHLPALDFGPGLHAISLAAGEHHTCAILSDASVRCWGEAAGGELGIGELSKPVLSAHDAVPVFGAGVVAVAISCGSRHSCALTDHGQLTCWGYNTNGEVGVGDDNPQYRPRAVDLGKDPQGVAFSARAVVADGYHTCAVLSDGGLKCWGSNFEGELGIGSDEDHVDTPQPVNLGGTVKLAAIKHGHSCALLDDDRLMCWGLAKLSRFYKIVGKTIPYHVTNLNGKTPKLIATGHDEACVVTADDVTYCLDDMQLYDFKP